MLKKYKHLTKINDLKLIPSRVLKFKKSKWSKLKSVLIKKVPGVEVSFNAQETFNLPRVALGSNGDSSQFSNENGGVLKQKLKIFDKFKIFISRGRFLHLSNLSKEKVQSKLKLKYLLNQNNFSLKQKYKDKDFYIKNIYKDKFCINGIISSYYFFNRFAEIRDKFKEGLLSINTNKYIYYDSLKQGDIIKIDGNAINLKKNINSMISNYVLPSHLECDIYSQTIVVVKDFSMTSQEDYHLLCLEYINAQKI